MPYKNPKDRKHTKAAKAYIRRDDVLERQRARNKARYHAEKAGIVRDGDGKDLDHIKPLSKGGGNGKSNIRVVPASENRSFSRNSDHSVKKNKPRKRG